MKLFLLILASVISWADSGLSAPTSTNLYVAVGYGGRRLASADGLHWTHDQNWSEISADDDNVLFNVAFGAGKFVAVGGATKVGHVLTTRDGQNWDEPFKYKSRIATVSFGNTWFVACSGDKFLRSPNGDHWTEGASLNFNGGLNPRKSAFGNGTFVVIGEADPEWKYRIRFRASTTDGVSMTHFATNNLGDRALAFGAGKFVLVGQDGLRESSVDGMHWDRSGFEKGENLNSIVWTGRQFLVAGEKVAYSSPDGLAWQRLATNFPCTVLTAGQGLLLGASWGGHLWSSTDSLAFLKAGIASSNSIEAIACGSFLVLP